MNLEEQVRLHKELSKKIDELESQKKDLGIAILQQMSDKTLKFPGLIVRRIDRLSIKLTIEQARALNAIKLEESVDKDKIKVLYNSGQTIDGVCELQYIQITSTPND